MVICQSWDPALAAAEIERCAAKGARALCFTENPVADGLPSLYDPDGHWDPLFGACQDADLPVCMHIGSSGFMPIIDMRAPFTSTIAAATAGGQLAMTNMLLSPIPVRFPRIKLVWSEAGIGWVPALLERADRQVERHAGWAGELDMRPSDVFRRNMWCCMVEEPVGLTLHDLIGVDRILAETDYPHADTPYPHTQKAYAEVFAGLPAEVVDAVSHGNAERLFNWEMADEALLSSPDVERWRASLAADPFAAMGIRHDVAGIAVGAAALEAGDACREMVHRGALIEECGLTITADGSCDDGHRAW
jgi:predicted TIM-barrel fold metal-dependent hydrolase